MVYANKQIYINGFVYAGGKINAKRKVNAKPMIIDSMTEQKIFNNLKFSSFTGSIFNPLPQLGQKFTPV